MLSSAMLDPVEEDRLDAVFGALADRTRRSLLSRLAEGPQRVTTLAEPFEMTLPAVSKHLRVLERAGLVDRTIDGRVHRCSLNASPLRCAQRWVEDYRTFWEDTLASLAQHVERDDP